MAVFLLIMTSLVAGLSTYVGFRLIPTTWSGGARTMAWMGVGLVVAVQPLSFLLRFTGRDLRGAADVLAWLAYLCMGLFALALTFTALRDLGWLGARAASLLPEDPSRRQMLFQMTSAGVLGAAALAVGVGFVRAVQRPSVVEVTVPIANLADALVGFTIAQISDIHIGPTIKRDTMQSIVDAVNGLDADLIAVTGDLVDGSVADLREHTAPLAELKARHGAWFVTGNHEYYSGALEWIDEVRRLGVRALVNEHAVIDHDGQSVVVAGVTDYTAGGMLPAHATDPHKAIAGAPTTAAFRLLLAHQPRSAYEAEKAGFQLQLSGHTHGGQFFPGTLLVRLVQPFVEGLHKLNDMHVYTNRGTGYWGPPVRHTSVAGEITKLILVRA